MTVSQPTLFEKEAEKAEIEKILLYALGEFQSRGKVLADRQLALDRLRGAFKRAADNFGIAELSDRQIVENLEVLGARIVEVPSFVAKHPFRVTISNDLAEKSFNFYKNSLEND